ncbi:hypothetical protein BV898_18070 [Hypsibius exemplaris]|uniref:Uncharacterized protein n=1 Tax=Hypsibius exemplaris TaxID=2072580 RepID=A0A9X6NPT0_HYPEX|nr:hypothetical protein BV898_18070 [Hypsibius exemplaris]
MEHVDLSDLFAVTETVEKGCQTEKENVVIDVKGPGTKHELQTKTKSQTRNRSTGEVSIISDGRFSIQNYHENRPMLDLKIEGYPAKCLWDTGHVYQPYPQEVIKQLGLEHLVDPFQKFQLRSATGHQVMSEGAIQLKVDTFGRQANPLAKDNFGGFSKNLYSSMQEARRTAEKEDIVDLSRLEKAFLNYVSERSFVHEFYHAGGNDIKKPKLECPCGYMSESEYEKVRHGDVCIEAMKSMQGDSTFHMRLWKPFYGQIYSG